MVEIATKSLSSLTLPRLLQERLGNAKSQFPAVWMAIVGLPRVLIVGGHFTLMCADEVSQLAQARVRNELGVREVHSLPWPQPVW